MNDQPYNLRGALASHWPTKLWLGAVMVVLFCGGYAVLQRVTLLPPVTLSPTAIDGAVGFAPGWTVVYFSFYTMLPLAWLIPTRDQLRRYATGFTAVTCAGFACFVAYPVVGPRPAVVTDDPLYNLLIRYDTPLNSFPSMHVALATYTALVATAAVPERWRGVLGAMLFAWVALIAYSTLATKQHYFIDLPPGGVLGWVGFRLAWRAPATPAVGSLPAEVTT